MSDPKTDARELRLRAAKKSPELADLHDREGWLALYTEDAVVEDPVGSPPCRRGAFTRPGKKDDLERFYETFIAPCSIRVEENGDLVVGDTVVRDVVLHVQLPGGGKGSIAAVLQYDLRVDAAGPKVARMRAYWDAGQNGRAMLASGFAGKLTSMLSGLRLFRVLGSDWAKRYIDGTKRGIRREGGVLADKLASALRDGDAATLEGLAAPDATVTLPGAAPTPLRALDGRALALSFERPINSGFVTVVRCRAKDGARAVSGIGFVDFDPSTRRVASLRLFWE